MWIDATHSNGTAKINQNCSCHFKRGSISLLNRFGIKAPSVNRGSVHYHSLAAEHMPAYKFGRLCIDTRTEEQSGPSGSARQAVAQADPDDRQEGRRDGCTGARLVRAALRLEAAPWAP